MQLGVKNMLDALELSFREVLRTPEGVEEPVAILWTDSDGQWASLLPRLRAVFPQLYSLGKYSPVDRVGPAIWLRCIVDRCLAESELPKGSIPILYLPNVSRQSLGAGLDCPLELQPLVELQYRGRVWHQRNGLDWTVAAFLVSEDGLDLDVSLDAKTKEAVLRALPLLLEIPIENLRGHRLESDDFDRLAVSDPARDLLQWMGTGDLFRTSRDESQWQSFCNVSRAEFKFDPDKNSPSEAASALIKGGGRWDDIWDRFQEAPKLYSGVSELLRDYRGQRDLLQLLPERDPVTNTKFEEELRVELEALPSLQHKDAVETILRLEEKHAPRRVWVWTKLGESPLALALEPLARLASRVGKPLGGSKLGDVVEAYTKDVWQCDYAALESLAAGSLSGDITLIQSVVRALYGPWLDATSRHFQERIALSDSDSFTVISDTSFEKDVCTIFADGLRYDLAGALKERLSEKGFKVTLNHRLSPLPTVTATAKPFAANLSGELAGSNDAADFSPCFSGTDTTVTAQRLRDKLAEGGIEILGDEITSPKGGYSGGWLETGHLDELGHKLGARLAMHLETEIGQLLEQIISLFDAGWVRIRVVTDHGWLLLPGGLPRVELPKSLTETKWARCAVVRGESQTQMIVRKWHWNDHVLIAFPPGSACFTAGNEYSHGGISPQECIVPEMIVERGGGATKAKITTITWRGMRCRIVVSTNDPSVKVDLRLNWKQAETSLAASAKEIGSAGEASLAVMDDSHEGDAATVVIIDSDGNVIDRMATTIGEAL